MNYEGKHKTLVRYLIGTEDEMMNIPEIKKHQAEYQKAVENKDWKKAEENIEDFLEVAKLDEQSVEKEFTGTMFYFGASLTLSLLAPYAGIPFTIDSSIRVLRMAHDPGSSPVGLVGTFREKYQKLMNKYTK